MYIIEDKSERLNVVTELSEIARKEMSDAEPTADSFARITGMSLSFSKLITMFLADMEEEELVRCADIIDTAIEAFGNTDDMPNLSSSCVIELLKIGQPYIEARLARLHNNMH